MSTPRRALRGLRGGWGKTIAAGLLAGLAAGFLMTLVLSPLRLVLGVPLPVELGSDRFLPFVMVDDFLGLLMALGGFMQAKQIGYLSAFLGQVAAGGALGVLYAVLTRRAATRAAPGRSARDLPRRPDLTLALALGLVFVVSLALLWPELDANYRGIAAGPARLLSILSLALALALLGAVVVLAFGVMTRQRPLARNEPAGEVMGRRAFMVGAGAVVVGLASLGFRGLLYRRGAFEYDGLSVAGPGVAPVTPTDDFYIVTKNLIDPRVDTSYWSLRVDGHVEEEREYDLDDLRALGPVRQEQTLVCISNPVGGGLMSNAVWTGVPLARVLEAARPREGAVQAFFHAADGFTHEATLEKAMTETTFLAWEMNGAPLTHRHGYPLRLLVPGSYGEVSVKWITRIEVRDEEARGYYSRQGWEPNFVHTASRIDEPAFGAMVPRGGEVTVRGVAFAGDRGISRVEVSADGGRSWREARIDYHPSPLTWALWSLPWRPTRAGPLELVVRATDGAGGVQEPDVTPVNPDGAQGWHRIPVRVAA